MAAGIIAGIVIALLLAQLLLAWRVTYYRKHHHKLSFRYEVIATFLYPSIWLGVVPRWFREKHISRTTVRGVFEKFSTVLPQSAESTRYTRLTQQFFMSDLPKFFDDRPGLFDGLPGGVQDIYGYDTHCCICLSIGPKQVKRYYIPWDRLAALLHAINDFYDRGRK